MRRFLHNKYRTWYFALCERAKSRCILDVYFEKHHIVPKCMGGGNDPENLVKLTFREHFLAHWLLIKFTEGSPKIKLGHAIHRMVHAVNGEVIIAAWQYDVAKRAKKAAGMSPEARAKLSRTQKARGPTPKLLAHLVRLNARFRAEAKAGNNHWRRSALAQGERNEKQLAALRKGRQNQKGRKRPASAKMLAHLARLNSRTDLNELRKQSLAKGRVNFWADPIKRAERSTLMRDRPKPAGTGEKISKALQERWRTDPVYRERQLAILAEARAQRALT